MPFKKLGFGCLAILIFSICASLTVKLQAQSATQDIVLLEKTAEEWDSFLQSLRNLQDPISSAVLDYSVGLMRSQTQRPNHRFAGSGNSERKAIAHLFVQAMSVNVAQPNLWPAGFKADREFAAQELGLGPIRDQASGRQHLHLTMAMQAYWAARAAGIKDAQEFKESMLSYERPMQVEFRRGQFREEIFTGDQLVRFLESKGFPIISDSGELNSDLEFLLTNTSYEAERNKELPLEKALAWYRKSKNDFRKRPGVDLDLFDYLTINIETRIASGEIAVPERAWDADQDTRLEVFADIVRQSLLAGDLDDSEVLSGLFQLLRSELNDNRGNVDAKSGFSTLLAHYALGVREFEQLKQRYQERRISKNDMNFIQMNEGLFFDSKIAGGALIAWDFYILDEGSVDTTEIAELMKLLDTEGASEQFRQTLVEESNFEGARQELKEDTKAREAFVEKLLSGKFSNPKDFANAVANLKIDGEDKSIKIPNAFAKSFYKSTLTTLRSRVLELSEENPELLARQEEILQTKREKIADQVVEAIEPIVAASLGTMYEESTASAWVEIVRKHILQGNFNVDPDLIEQSPTFAHYMFAEAWRNMHPEEKAQFSGHLQSLFEKIVTSRPKLVNGSLQGKSFACRKAFQSLNIKWPFQ